MKSLREHYREYPVSHQNQYTLSLNALTYNAMACKAYRIFSAGCGWQCHSKPMAAQYGACLPINCTIKVKGNNISSSKLRENLGKIFDFLEFTNLDIVSCRFYKKEEVASITLGNIIDKIALLSHYYKSPVTFSIEPVEKKERHTIRNFLLYLM